MTLSNIITQSRRWGPRWRSMWRPPCDSWALDLPPEALVRTLARMAVGYAALEADLSAGQQRADAVDAARRMR